MPEQARPRMVQPPMYRHGFLDMAATYGVSMLEVGLQVRALMKKRKKGVIIVLENGQHSLNEENSMQKLDV